MEKYDIMINVEKIKVEMEWQWNKKVGIYNLFLIRSTSLSTGNLRFGWHQRQSHIAFICYFLGASLF